MIEKFGNIWENAHKYDAVVITTNGFIKKNGEAVMGRGIALEAKKLFPEMPRWLGYCLKTTGNRVHITSFDYGCTTDNGSDVCEQVIFTFPVKPILGANGEPGWRSKAKIDLIERSAKQLRDIVNDFSYMENIIMPRPGCGNGGLRWEDVKPVIEPYLDDRFTVMERL